MNLEIYLDAMDEARVFEIAEIMKDIEKYTDKKFTNREMNEIMSCYWNEGMVNLADFLSDEQINKLLEIG